MFKRSFTLLAAVFLATFCFGQAPAVAAGKLVIYCPSPAGLADKQAADFTKKTGIAVEMFQGTTGEILARLEAEKANPMADVVIMASWPDGMRLKKKNLLLSYAPAGADKMVQGWSDADNMLFGASASAVGVIYNTRVVPTLSADWAELASVAYKDQLTIPDPLKSGSCKDFISGYINAFGQDGWKVWEKMAENGLSIPGANKAALDAVITGEKGILIAGVDYNAYAAMKKGEPLSIYYPKSGTVVNPRPAMILKSSKNPENAKAFMDYLLSDSAQKLVCEAFLLPGRADVQNDNRANLASIPQLKIDWDWMMENSTDIAKKLISLCKK